MALTLLAFLLPIYAKQLGASALGIGGLFAVAQCLIVLVRPVIGWASDRLGRKGFFVAGMVCYAGTMGVFALAHSVTMLYLAQLLHGLASALTWTSAYTMTTELAMPAQHGKAVGRVDEYAARRGTLWYGIGPRVLELAGAAHRLAGAISDLYSARRAGNVAGVGTGSRNPAGFPPSSRAPAHGLMAISAPHERRLSQLSLHHHDPSDVLRVLTRRIDYGRAAAGVRLSPGDPDRQFPALTSGVLERSLGA